MAKQRIQTERVMSRYCPKCKRETDHRQIGKPIKEDAEDGPHRPYLRLECTVCGNEKVRIAEKGEA